MDRNVFPQIRTRCQDILYINAVLTKPSEQHICTRVHILKQYRTVHTAWLIALGDILLVIETCILYFAYSSFLKTHWTLVGCYSNQQNHFTSSFTKIQYNTLFKTQTFLHKNCRPYTRVFIQLKFSLSESWCFFLVQLSVAHLSK